MFRNDLVAQLSDTYDRIGGEVFLPARFPLSGQGFIANGVAVHDTPFYEAAVESLFGPSSFDAFGFV